MGDCLKRVDLDSLPIKGGGACQEWGGGVFKGGGGDTSLHTVCLITYQISSFKRVFEAKL